MALAVVATRRILACRASHVHCISMFLADNISLTYVDWDARATALSDGDCAKTIYYPLAGQKAQSHDCGHLI
jgi:hypothetical protein